MDGADHDKQQYCSDNSEVKFKPYSLDNTFNNLILNLLLD